MTVTRMESRLESLEKSVTELQSLRQAVEELQRANRNASDERALMQVAITEIQEQGNNILQLLQNRLPPPTSPPPPPPPPPNGDAEEEVNNNANMGNNMGLGGRPPPEGERLGDGQRYRRLDMPLCDGDDPVGWTFRMERYFSVNGIPENERLDAAVVGLEGQAVSWFQWVEARAPMSSWPELKRGIVKRFHESQAGNNHERLAALKQVGSIADYRGKFEVISATLDDVSDASLMGMFMNGLKEEIRADVRLLKPTCLGDLMDMAADIEGRNQVVDRARQKREGKLGKRESPFRWEAPLLTQPKFSLSSETPKSQGSVQGTRVTPAKSSEAKAGSASPTKVGIPTHSSGSSNRGSRRLSEAELNRLRGKGLCFKCEEKWSPTHRCKSRQLQLLIAEDEEVEEEEVAEKDFVELEEEEPEKEYAEMELSQATVKGISSYKTMKMRGTIRGREVIVLVDSGATHNFIAQKLVEELALRVFPTTEYSVAVGDGRRTYRTGKCKEVPLDLQGLLVTQTFYPFPLSNTDVVLGIAWLESLGEVKVNWGRLYMKIKTQGQWVCLNGDPTLTQMQSTYKACRKALKGKAEGYLLEVRTLEGTNDREQSEGAHTGMDVKQ